MVDFNVCLENKTVLVTGAAGFIGASLVERLCQDISGIKVIGVDNLNDYYDVSLKETRLEGLNRFSSFDFIKGVVVKLFCNTCG